MLDKNLLNELGIKFYNSRSHEDFTELYNYSKSFLMGYSFKYFPNISYHNREIAISNFFLSLYEKIDQYDLSQGTFSNWTLAIFKNELLYVGYRSRHTKKPNHNNLVELTEISFLENYSLVEQQIEKEHQDYMIQAVFNAVEQIPEVYKGVVKDKYINGLSNPEIYEKYGYTNMNTLKTHIHEGMKRLRMVLHVPEREHHKMSDNHRKVLTGIGHRKALHKKKWEDE
jgi:RNA polymerase sigma factor (sigma-70 family)